jgi:hypothetical protein
MNKTVTETELKIGELYKAPVPGVKKRVDEEVKDSGALLAAGEKTDHSAAICALLRALFAAKYNYGDDGSISFMYRYFNVAIYVLNYPYGTGTP